MSTSEERKAARAHWPVRLLTLAEADEDDWYYPTAQAGWDATMLLSAQFHALSQPLPPRLPREQWPVRFFKRGEPRDD